MNQTDIHKAVAAVCPIAGIGFGDLKDKSTWKIDFANSATNEEKIAAQGVIDAIDVADVKSNLDLTGG